jgi:sec-independent protein translocase protein TatA
MLNTMTTLAYIGGTEVWIVCGILVLLFGATKIPQLAKGLGEGIREFKKSVETDEPTPETTTPRSATATDETEKPSSGDRAA